ncbi:MAG: hypothetical protein PCFJNLEI_02926 [Verrucomicrobiae bacterium]|nr:hypothetical protein [Verrucomicrobiae bacterium]
MTIKQLLFLVGCAVGIFASPTGAATNNSLATVVHTLARGDYALAYELIQQVAGVQTQTADWTQLFLGECAYQMQNTNVAVKHFEAAWGAGIGGEEAGDRLINIFRTEGRLNDVGTYERKVAELRKSIQEEPGIGTVNHVTEPPPKLRGFIRGTSSHPYEVRIGDDRLRDGDPISAARWYELAIIISIKLPDRMTDPSGEFLYRKLCQAYARKAKLLKTKDFPATEVKHAEELARHYEFKSMVVAAHQKPR